MMRVILIVLGSLFGLIVLAVLGLFIYSKRPDAGDIAGEIDIDRPAPEVWAWIAEPPKVKQWVSWMTEIESKPGPQELGREDEWVMEDEQMDEPIRIHGKITAWDPPHRLVQHVDHAMFVGDYTYTLTETNGRTHLATTGTFEYLHPVWKIFEPLVTPEAKKKHDGDLARLKQLVEAAPTTH